ncbi:predicted protein [Chaetoceros tenuissimus]|uniref:Uncharacterized protein n=1 Tax=Chaetoceros tenuissimus TaxID=426638 RepID=A0AAD3H6X5_9STRA|nr:predicted protein [Chaetoceros tenuissimus]
MKRTRTAPSVRLLKLILAQKWFKAAHHIRRKGRELKAEYQQLDQVLDKKAATIERTTSTEKGTSSTTYISSIASLTSPASQDDTCKELYLRHILPEAIFQKAPKYVLKAIIGISPSILLTLPDENGRLPLHIACLDGASLSTTRLLLSLDETPKGIHCDEHFSEQASAVDYTNRKPLHYAVENLISCCRKESGVKFIHVDPDSDEAMIEKREKGKEELLHIIHDLLQTHPDAVLHVDEQNDTPIDLLQKARRLKKKKKRYYDHDYETIEDTCKLLRVKAVEVHRRRKLRYELLGCDSYNKRQGISCTRNKKSRKGPQNEKDCNNSNQSTATITQCSSSGIHSNFWGK